MKCAGGWKKGKETFWDLVTGLPETDSLANEAQFLKSGHFTKAGYFRMRRDPGAIRPLID
jgi:hypothetical protein